MKKLRKKIIASLLVIGVVASCLTGCGDKKSKNSYDFDEANPVKYFQSVEAKNRDYAAEKAAETLTKVSGFSSIAKTAINSSATVEIDPEFFTTVLGTSLPFNLKSVGITGTMNVKEDKGFNILGNVTINDQNILSIDTVFDQAKNMFYLKVPEISDNYLYSSTEDLENTINSASDDMSEIDVPDQPFSMTKMDMSAFADIDSKEIINLYKKYSQMFVDATVKAEIDKDAALDVNGQQINCTKVTSTLTNEEFNDVIQKMLTEMKTDETINKFLKAYGISNDDFNAELDKVIEEIESDETDDSELMFEVYINDDKDIIGRKIYEKGNEDNYFKYGVLEGENGQSTTEISFADEEDGNVKIIIDNTITDDISNGTATISSDGTDYVVTYKNVSYTGDKMTGEFSIDLSSALQSPATLIAKVDATTESQKLTYILEMNGKEYITVNFDSQKSEFNDFDIPTIDESKDYNLNDEDSLTAFGQEFQNNSEAIITSVATALGVDVNTLMQILGSLLQM